MVKSKYLLSFIAILLIELFIGIYVHDHFIRPYIGDVLVVALIYSFVRIFVNGDAFRWAFTTFIFACIVEFLQYLNIVDWLGLGHNKVARILIGTAFSWIDIVAYFAGFLLVVIVETTTERQI